ncbi:ACP S-malonyltransferase [Tenacibaculum sp. 190524A02b]|uniref:ACP S-malonyltransferase n=1 Tax=Tenacibaculum vairaonense TaxID=3137860 RepID=UPI0032B23268
MKRLTCLFPGQGTIDKDVVNKEWYSSKISQLIFEEAEKILSWNIDCYLRELSYQELAQTNIAQPLIYTLNMAMYYTLFNSNKLKPSIFLGHSLGEYCALVASEAITFNQGLEIVAKRGELMAEYTSIEETAMASIIGADIDKITQLLNQNNTTTSVVDIAAYNSKEQIVLSGHKAQILSIVNQLKDEKIRFTLLNVGGPFHSRLYKDIEEKFRSYIEKITFSPPKNTVVSSIIGEVILQPEQIKKALSEQITSPVLWAKAVGFLNENYNWLGIEVGGKTVLKRLLSNHTVIATSEYNATHGILQEINNSKEQIFDFSAAAIRTAVTFPNKCQKQVDVVISTFEEIQQQRESFLQTNEIDWHNIEDLLKKLLLAKGYEKAEVEKELMAIKKETGVSLSSNT